MTDKQVSADTQELTGAIEAIARILAVMAKHQELEIEDDVLSLFKLAGTYNSREEPRKTGYTNTLGSFFSEYSRREEAE